MLGLMDQTSCPNTATMIAKAKRMGAGMTGFTV
jgi:hypothetical protein